MNHLCFFKSSERLSWSYATLAVGFSGLSFRSPHVAHEWKGHIKKVRPAAKTDRMSKGAADQQPKADSWGRISTYHSEYIYQKLPI